MILANSVIGNLLVSGDKYLTEPRLVPGTLIMMNYAKNLR